MALLTRPETSSFVTNFIHIRCCSRQKRNRISVDTINGAGAVVESVILFLLHSTRDYASKGYFYVIILINIPKLFTGEWFP